MKRTIERLGDWYERLRGPRTTTVITQDRWGRSYSFRHVVESMEHNAYIESERLVYRVCFRRWWIPDIEYCVFRVQGRLHHPDTETSPDRGQWRQYVPPEFFDANYYPSMVGGLLKWTRLPHLYAIHAHMDRYHFKQGDHALT